MKDFVIRDNTVAGVWFQMLDYICSHPGKELSPLLINLSDIDPVACEKVDPIREALDKALLKRELNSVNTVANTIFPLSLYRLAKFDRNKFYKIYNDIVPRLKAVDSRNKDGLYFERLIAYDDSETGNQLEFIIKEFTSRKGVRRSLLQASVFDPKRDHKRNAQIAFPCLQHVSFTYIGDQLSVNAFYATQQLFDKAFGNLLGLVRLGNFMAREMQLTLKQINCFVGVEKLERITKDDTDLDLIIKIGKQYQSNEQHTEPAI